MSLRRHDNIVNVNCDWSDESSDDYRKQAVTVQTWRDVAYCSRLARRQPGKLGRRTSTAAYGAQPEMVTRLNADDVEPVMMLSDVLTYMISSYRWIMTCWFCFRLGFLYVILCLSWRCRHSVVTADALFFLSFFLLLPLPSARQHPSYGDCLEVKRQYYQNCSVLSAGLCDTMFTVSSTLIWVVVTGTADWVCHIGTLTPCVEAVA